MAMLIEEIMNREIFSTAVDEPATEVLARLLQLGISNAPVLDTERRPVGMVSLRDLAGCQPGAAVSAHMSVPPVAVQAGANIDEAGLLLSETGYHHLVVVGAEGRAVGMLSALDVMRGILGLPARHPDCFPHYDQKTGMCWTDDTVLSPERVEAAPSGPGVLVLIHGGRSVPETIIRVESTADVRGRLAEMLRRPRDYGLSYWLERGNLRFRAAAILDPERRRLAVDVMLGKGDDGPIVI